MRWNFRILFLLVLWIAAYAPILPELISRWATHSNDSHGVLVPLISLYFVWARREKLAAATPRANGWGGVVLLLSLLVYVLGTVGDVAVLARCMMVVSLYGLLLYNYGTEVTRILRLPVFFLLFMVPVPVSVLNTVAFPLQLLASKASAALIQLLSIPVYREGNMLYFSRTQLEVAEACSGIRSLVSLAMLAVIFLTFLKGGRARKAILLVSCVPIALLANILRVTLTGVLASIYGDVVARGFLHSFSGFVVFFFGFCLLLIEFWLLDRIGKGRRP